MHANCYAAFLQRQFVSQMNFIGGCKAMPQSRDFKMLGGLLPERKKLWEHIVSVAM